MQLGGLLCAWEATATKSELRETVCMGVNWVKLAQDIAQCRAVVKYSKNFITGENF
jgi:hypothetical protein